MWYKVPESRPRPTDKPKPIFPWEREPERPKATRVFSEDLPLEPTSAPQVSSPVHAFSTVHYQDELETAPAGADVGVTGSDSVSSPKSADEQWQAFQQSNVNAWDSVPGIETYVRAIMESHGRRGKTQILHQVTGTEDINSPLLERRNRRESLILTDFPSAVERPSLPVTPAPVRRPTFWGGERDEAGELPAAAGVPDQTEWVCPQCGFSSVNASDFQHRRESLASVTTAVVTPLPSAFSAILPDVSPAKEEASTLSKASIAIEPPPSPHKLGSVKDVAKPTTAPAPPSLHPRSGLSPSGVPLASLTRPELFASQTHSSGFFSASISSAAGLRQSPVANLSASTFSSVSNNKS